MVERILEPGAATSILPRPRLLNEDRRLFCEPVGTLSSDDTVTTPSSSVGMSSQPLLSVRVTKPDAGWSSGLVVSLNEDLSERSRAELPAAAACTTPCSVDQATARRTASLAA